MQTYIHTLHMYIHTNICIHAQIYMYVTSVNMYGLYALGRHAQVCMYNNAALLMTHSNLIVNNATYRLKW